MKAAATGQVEAAMGSAAALLLKAGTLVAVSACLSALCLSSPALAAGRADDVAATRAYLRASAAYASGAGAWIGASVAAIAARARETAGECPSALTYAPRDEAFGEIGDEANSTLYYAGLAPSGAARLGWARSVSRLHWSDRRLTRLVHAQAAEEVALVALALPDVCADIEAWKTDAYASLPQAVAEFFAHLTAIESGSYVEPSEQTREALIMRLLTRYEGPGERRTIKGIKRLEDRTDAALGEAEGAAQARLAAGLGVSAL
jgi:hypothetical protein